MQTNACEQQPEEQSSYELFCWRMEAFTDFWCILVHYGEKAIVWLLTGPTLPYICNIISS